VAQERSSHQPAVHTDTQLKYTSYLHTSLKATCLSAPNQLNDLKTIHHMKAGHTKIVDQAQTCIQTDVLPPSPTQHLAHTDTLPPSVNTQTNTRVHSNSLEASEQLSRINLMKLSPYKAQH